MELCQTTLHHTLTTQEDSEEVSVAQKKLWSVQLSAGLTCLHAHRVVHCDVKCENFFLIRNADGSLRALLGDFGLSRQTNEKGETTIYMNQAYSSRHRPPERTSLPALAPRLLGAAPRFHLLVESRA